MHRFVAPYAFAIVVLFAGNAQVPERWGADVPLTLTPEAAVAAARILDPAVVVPIHQDGWVHFTSGPEELEEAFAAAGLAGRLRHRCTRWRRGLT